MNDPNLKVEWLDEGKEPQCPPDPEFPHGMDFDASHHGQPSCAAELPYPAKRCGKYLIECTFCGITCVVTTAGRPDDPRSVRLPCKGAKP